MRDVLSANLGLVVAGLVSFVLMGAGQALFGPALPAFARTFGIGVGQAGLLVSAHWVGAALGVAAMFWRGDGITPRLALAAMAAGAGGIAAGPGWGLTLAAALVFGLGYGCSTVIYNRRFLATFGARGPSMLAALNAIFGIGAIGAPLVFLALGSDPRAAYAAVAVLAAATFAVARAAPVPAAQAGAGGAAPPLSPAILALGALAIGTEACLIGLGPTGLIARGAAEDGAATLLSGFFVAFLIARLALVPVAGAVPPLPLLAAALAGTAALATLLALGGPEWLFVPMGAVAGLFFPAYYMGGVARLGDHPRVAPMLISAGLAGGICAPVALGAMMAQTGAGSLFALVAGLTCAAAAGAAAVARADGRAAPAAPAGGA